MFVLGAALIFQDILEREAFLAPAPRLAGVAVAIGALIAAAFAAGGRPRPKRGRRAPKVWLVGTVALVASSLFFARPESWLGVAIGIALILATAVVTVRWSRRPGWSAAHRLALAGGALLTYVWGGFVLLSLEGAASAANLIGQSVLALGAVALLAAAGRAVRGRPEP